MSRLSCVIVLITLGLLSTPVSLPAQTQHASLVSQNVAGTDSGHADSYYATVSADGRYVAFTSLADDLVQNDLNNKSDVFVRDLQTGTTKLVSINLAHTGSGNGGSTSPSISADGRFITFDSSASNLVSQPIQSPAVNVYVRDMVSGVTTLVSIDATGTKGGNHNSLASAISADGKVVTYASVASDLVPNDSNGRIDVFARNLQAGTTALVTMNFSGTGGGNGDSSNMQGGGVIAPLISRDGRFVAFLSHATDLVNLPDTNDGADVFVRDLVSGITTLVSRNAAGTAAADSYSGQLAMTPDGSKVAFASGARDIAANAFGGAFVWDRVTNTTVVASLNPSGGSQSALFPVLSADGRYVAFMGSTADLIPGSPFLGYSIFVRDLAQGVTRLVSVNRQGTGSGNRESIAPAISADGRYVAFLSEATDLVDVPDMTFGVIRDAFVRDLQTGETILASINYSGTQAANQCSGPVLLSANGRTLVFTSEAANLVATDSNDSQDVFAFPLASTPAFDLCIQDESNGNLLQVNTTTGDYQFINCSGLTLSGTGRLTKRGSQLVLQHNAADRRVTANIDTSTQRATASIQLLSQGRMFGITDRNITNNTCGCQ